MAMHHALVGLMCDSGPWRHPNGDAASIIDIEFNRDGTGKLNAIGGPGLGYLFEMTMQWKFIPTPPRPIAGILKDECFRHTNKLTKQPKFLGSARLLIQMGSPQNREWSRLLLLEAACLPREFTIVVEEGDFAAVQGSRHELRMTFDISPYPALEAYNEHSGRSLRGEDIIPWLNEFRSFYAGELPYGVEKGRATDDDTVLGYHASNCAMS